MISGTDVVIKIKQDPWAVNRVISLFMLRHPDAVLEEAMEHSPKTEREVFLYVDREAKETWDEHGLTKRAGNRMIHVLAGKGRLTIVVNDVKKWRNFLQDVKKVAARK